MKNSFVYQLAIRSVEVRSDFMGAFAVVYWSPTIKDYWSAENLTRVAAEQIAKTIKTRLALEWGAPNIEN